MQSLEFLWNGGNTRRFHTVPTLMVDTVGHHSFNVVCIIMVLRPHMPVELLRAAIKHDTAEHKTGDMPAPTKRAMPSYINSGPGGESFRTVFGRYEEDVAKAHGVDLEQDTLSPAEAWVLKLADALDGMRFTIQERRMGNRHPSMVEAYANFHSYAAKLLYGEAPTHEILQFAQLVELAQPQDAELFHYLTGEWHRA